MIPVSLSADCGGVSPPPFLPPLRRPQDGVARRRVLRLYKFGRPQHRLTSCAIPNVSLAGSPSLASAAISQQPLHNLHQRFPLSAGGRDPSIPNVKRH